jgi:EAL domain-containing protein (putative c-di-GMP-specific phosphodiesterase class I)/GGDEF domain-containing protein
MRDSEQRAQTDSDPVLAGDDRLVQVGLNPELSPWQRRELNQLLIDLPRNASDLPGALQLAMQGICEAMGWSVAFARWDDGSESGSAWHSTLSTSSEVEALKSALERGPVAGWNEDGKEPSIRIEPLIALPETRAREAARNAGLAGYALLPILSAGKPVALMELLATTAPPRTGGLTRPTEIRDGLEVLAGSLGLIATGQRMRAAVTRAATHARRNMAELAEARAELEGSGTDALYEERTGLPTRPILFDRIRQAIRRRQRSPRDQFAVLVAEVQGLDRVEDRGGAQAVEDVMVAAGRRLFGHTRPADTTAVDGPGRFILTVESIRSVEEALGVADRVQKELRRPFPTARSDVRLDVRIGLVLGGPAYDGPEALVADATAAAARAANSRERIQVFDRTLEENHQQRERMRTDLAAALERREFSLEYQPIVSLLDGRITGLETFLRWRHPELGMVPPDQFIPVAAESPLIHDLGLWVIEQACDQINRWRGHSSSGNLPPVGVNVLGRQLFHEGFLSRVREILERHGIQGRQVRFDVSEGELMRDAEKAASVLDRLQGMGIDVAIDDFGTGYSSLSLLHDLPVRALKIDRSFISHRREKLRKWGVARTIVELAKILEVDVIAEGIETREQFLAMRQAGCKQAQGYHFSGPVGAAKAEALIRDGYPLDLEAPRR